MPESVVVSVRASKSKTVRSLVGSSMNVTCLRGAALLPELSFAGVSWIPRGRVTRLCRPLLRL